jgi:hypothetical protein
VPTSLALNNLKEIKMNIKDKQKIEQLDDLYGVLQEVLSGHEYAAIMAAMTMLIGEIGAELSMEKEDFLKRVLTSVNAAFEVRIAEQLQEAKDEGEIQ